VEASKSAASEPAKSATESAAEASKSATEPAPRHSAVNTDGKASSRDSRPQKHETRLGTARNSRGHLAFSVLHFGLAVAVTGANAIFSVPGGSCGLNTESAIRGAKFQSVKTALNCGCEGWFL
jgi:hypothetical protein